MAQDLYVRCGTKSGDADQKDVAAVTVFIDVIYLIRTDTVLEDTVPSKFKMESEARAEKEEWPVTKPRRGHYQPRTRRSAALINECKTARKKRFSTRTSGKKRAKRVDEDANVEPHEEHDTTPKLTVIQLKEVFGISADAYPLASKPRQPVDRYEDIDEETRREMEAFMLDLMTRVTKVICPRHSDELFKRSLYDTAPRTTEQRWLKVCNGLDPCSVEHRVIAAILCESLARTELNALAESTQSAPFNEERYLAGKADFAKLKRGELLVQATDTSRRSKKPIGESRC